MLIDNKNTGRIAPTGFFFGKVVLKFRTGANQCFAGFVSFKFLEVFDEAFGQVFGFGFPFACLCVGVARVKDFRVYARQSGRNHEVEERDGFGRSLVDGAVQDGHTRPCLLAILARLPFVMHF